MSVDLESCGMRPPTAEDWPAVSRMLKGIWPQEGPLWDGVANGALQFPFLRPMCLFAGAEAIGCVMRCDLSVWAKGRAVPLAGIASVATPEAYRGKGIAKRLLTAVLQEVDRVGVESILFTGLPKVYVSAGFQMSPQPYWSLASSWPVSGCDGRYPVFSRIDDGLLRQMVQIRSKLYPRHDGDVARDSGYWSWYAVGFNLSSIKRIALLDERGYVRYEEEKDRVLLSELCCRPEDGETLGALLADVCRAACERSTPVVTLALPPSHALFRLLKERGVAVCPESGGEREVFMIRGAAGGPPSPWLQHLTWSLADKF